MKRGSQTAAKALIIILLALTLVMVIFFGAWILVHQLA